MRLEHRFVTVTYENHYIVRTTRVPPNTNLQILISIGVGGLAELPVLAALAEEVRTAAPFRDVVVIFIQHLLSDFEGLIKAFQQSGLQTENTYIIGIPYSTKEGVVQRLRATIPNVVAPETYPFREYVRTVLIEAHRHCEKTNRKFVVVEDGGYVASLMRDHPDGPRWASLCLGIVEQTRNGIWFTQDWQSRPERYENSLNVGVVNVAETRLKLDGESPLIGRAVVSNLERLLRPYEEQDLHGQKVLLIGCGSTGSEIGKELLARGCIVTVMEARPQAEIRNFPSGAKYIALDNLTDGTKDCDIIIGATGRGVGVPDPDSRPPIDHENIFLTLKDRVVLVNASSKMCEFNWEAINNVSTTPITKRGFGQERKLIDGKVLRIAADGFPVNFHNSESAPASKMQPILGMLYLAARRILEKKIELGVNNFSDEDQSHIKSIYDRMKKA